jgi:hypothetical protein
VRTAFFCSFICNFLGVIFIFLGHGLAGGQRKAWNVPLSRGQRRGNGQKVRHHSVYGLNASKRKQKQKKKIARRRTNSVHPTSGTGLTTSVQSVQSQEEDRQSQYSPSRARTTLPITRLDGMDGRPPGPDYGELSDSEHIVKIDATY